MALLAETTHAAKPPRGVHQPIIDGSACATCRIIQEQQEQQWRCMKVEGSAATYSIGSPRF